MESCAVSVHKGHNGWVHYLTFSLKQLYLLIPGLPVVLGSWTALLIIFLDSSVRNLARSTWSWPVYGEIMFFPLSDNGPNSAHWNIQKFRTTSVTNAISMFCNNKVAKVLNELFGFTHHEMPIVWHLGNEKPFYRPSIRTKPADIHLQGAGLLSKYWQISAGFLAFHAFLHLLFCMCSILIPCVIPLYYI